MRNRGSTGYCGSVLLLVLWIALFVPFIWKWGCYHMVRYLISHDVLLLLEPSMELGRPQRWLLIDTHEVGPVQKRVVAPVHDVWSNQSSMDAKRSSTGQSPSATELVPWSTLRHVATRNQVQSLEVLLLGSHYHRSILSHPWISGILAHEACWTLSDGEAGAGVESPSVKRECLMQHLLSIQGSSIAEYATQQMLRHSEPFDRIVIWQGLVELGPDDQSRLRTLLRPDIDGRIHNRLDRVQFFRKHRHHHPRPQLSVQVAKRCRDRMHGRVLPTLLHWLDEAAVLNGRWMERVQRTGFHLMTETCLKLQTVTEWAVDERWAPWFEEQLLASVPQLQEETAAQPRSHGRESPWSPIRVTMETVGMNIGANGS